MQKFIGLLRLYRPEQWLKNTFVFIPLFFDRKLFDTTALHSAVVAFFAFSFVASAIYCLNDILDVARDCLHPRKKFRPIAAGLISVPLAYCAMGTAILASSAIAVLVGGGN